MPVLRSHRVTLLVAIALVAAVTGTAVWWLKSDRTQSLLEAARQARVRHDFAQVKQLTGDALALSPRSMEALRLRAEAAEQVGTWTEAAADYERLAALQSQPDHAAQAFQEAGSAWMRAMRAREAEACLQKSAHLAPQRAEPFRLLAQIYSIQGRSEEFADQLLRLVQLGHYTVDDLIMLGQQQPFIDDPQRLSALLEADPAFRVPLMAVARRASVEHRSGDAERALREVVESHPGNIQARAVLGSLLWEHSPNSEEFRRWLAQLAPEADENAEIWRVRGAWLLRVGRNQQAVRCFWESFRRRPEQLAAANQLAQALAAVGEESLSRQFFEYLAHGREALDLTSRVDVEKTFRWAEPLVDELEALGRLWEAWAWSGLVAQAEPSSSWARPRATKLRTRLTSDIPRTDRASLPGADVDWTRFPLPARQDFLSNNAPASVAAAPAGSGSFAFEANGQKIGLGFQFLNGEDPATAGRRIFESTGGGIAALDYDRDGWCDLFFVQGGDWPVDLADAPGDALFRNQHGERFREATEMAGVHEPSFGQGVASGDFDSDGFPDLYIANIGRNRLLRNLGDGTFEDVTDLAGLQSEAWTISCLIADLDGDLNPDLFEVNYLQGGDAFEAICTDRGGHPRVCRPDIFPAAPDVLAFSSGDGRFEEQSEAVGLDLPDGRGMGIVAADFDRSGRLGLFISNDMSANYLLRVDADSSGNLLRLREDGLLAGVALDRDGRTQACMGVACADLNGDGRPELFVTNFAEESNTLYASQDDGLWFDATREAGLREPGFTLLGFGTEFFDADLDSHPDLLVLNGHIDDFSHAGQQLHMRPQFFRGLPEMRFSEVTGADLGEYFTSRYLGRGLAILDWNQDGRVDAAVSHLDTPVTMLTNRTKPMGRALQLRLVGTRCSRDAFGTRVRILTDSRTQHVQLTAGNGYAVSHERLLTVGLGSDERAQEVEISWPSGTVSRFTDVPGDASWIAVEGMANLLEIDSSL